MKSTLAAFGRPAEVVFVNDGSIRRSGASSSACAPRTPACASWTRPQPRLTAALDCGFRHARGPVIAMLDADLQNPPAETAEAPRPPARRRHGDRVRKDRRTRGSSASRARSARLPQLAHTTGARPRHGLRTEGLQARGDRAQSSSGRACTAFLPTLARMEGFKVVRDPRGAPARPSGRSHFGVSEPALEGDGRRARVVRWMWRNRFTYDPPRSGPALPRPGTPRDVIRLSLPASILAWQTWTRSACSGQAIFTWRHPASSGIAQRRHKANRPAAAVLDLVPDWQRPARRVRAHRREPVFMLSSLCQRLPLRAAADLCDVEPSVAARRESEQAVWPVLVGLARLRPGSASRPSGEPRLVRFTYDLPWLARGLRGAVLWSGRFVVQWWGERAPGPQACSRPPSSVGSRADALGSPTRCSASTGEHARVRVEPLPTRGT